MTAPDIAGCGWPLDARAELTDALAAAAGIRQVGRAEPFELVYADVAPGAAARLPEPAVLRAGPGAGVLLGILGCRAGRVRLLRPDGAVVEQDAAGLAAWLRASVEESLRAGVAETVARAGMTGARAEEIAGALLGAALGGQAVVTGSRLTSARPSMGAALRAGGFRRLAAGALAGYLAQLGLLVALWAAVGARAVGAHPAGAGWGVAALIAGVVLARLAASAAAGRLSIQTGAILRTRVLDGIVALDTETVRAAGIGQFMGRVADLEAVEALALGGGLTAAAAGFELLTGVVVVAFGVAPGAQLAAAAALLAIGGVLAGRVVVATRRWTARRLSLTHDLVERMVGQRTVVAQQPPELWHRDEDQRLADYARDGARADTRASALAVLLPRGWLLASVAALIPQAREALARPGAFAASLGGLLFIASALRRLALVAPALASAGIAWTNLRVLVTGAAQSGSAGPAAGRNAALDPAAPLIEARGVSFQYPGRAPVLEGCSFEVPRGARVLIEGASGGGKSTLAAVLCGLRQPSSGELRLAGVDATRLGTDRWRAHVGAAPQFHDNHVFSASFLFNLLLGRAWPPRQEDVAEAEAICRELDLGPLLARMPSGLEQLVGESGWQLSHGERGRLFVARALLQPLDVRVLDESFAALDPETLERAMACVLRRAETVVVIAHP